MNSTSAHFQSLDVGQCDRVHWSLITAAPITSLFFLSFLLTESISLIQFISFSHTLSTFLCILTSIFFPFHLSSQFSFLFCITISISPTAFLSPSLFFLFLLIPLSDFHPFSQFHSLFPLSISVFYIFLFFSLFRRFSQFSIFLSLFLFPSFCFSFSLFLIPFLYFSFPSFLSLFVFPPFSLLNSLVSYSLFSFPDFTQAPLFLNSLSSKQSRYLYAPLSIRPLLTLFDSLMYLLNFTRKVYLFSFFSYPSLIISQYFSLASSCIFPEISTLSISPYFSLAVTLVSVYFFLSVVDPCLTRLLF
ncbi:unnamed protein product [Acanthosepion pharaonis]|uniref:Uncharacterized protein n=1 Tax=Acanthosepion pharaonis TaxID=158019 RepID=A0A812BFH5_ACAPH|nr:unnamed protein product [Sepia pharaonis]